MWQSCNSTGVVNSQTIELHVNFNFFALSNLWLPVISNSFSIGTENRFSDSPLNNKYRTLNLSFCLCSIPEQLETVGPSQSPYAHHIVSKQ